MQKQILLIIFISAIYLNPTLAQEPESFFPHGVGDTWNTVDSQGPSWQRTIYKDSIGPDGSHNLFFGESWIPGYRTDTSLNVSEWPDNPRLNYLWYKLAADSGSVRENPQSGKRI